MTLAAPISPSRPSLAAQHLLLALILAAGPASGAFRTALVSDINETPVDASHVGMALVDLGAWRYYTAASGGEIGIWRIPSAGVADPQFVAPLGLAPARPGNPGQPAAPAPELRAFAGELFFAAWSPATGVELWKSSGEPGSEALVSDVQPGPPSGRPRDLTVLDDALCFFAETGAGTALHCTDGQVTDALVIVDDAPARIVAIEGQRIFYATGAGEDRRLWVYDRFSGTHAVLRPRTSLAERLFAGELYFVSGAALWRTRDTGAERITDFPLLAWTFGVDDDELVLFGLEDGELTPYRIGQDGVLRAVAASRFLGSPGAGYALRFVPGPTGELVGVLTSWFHGLTLLEPLAQGFEITQLVAGAWEVDGYAPIGGRYVFAGGLGEELIASDGSMAGTVTLSREALRPHFRESQVYFVEAAPTVRLWRSDGTVAGTQPVTLEWPGLPDEFLAAEPQLLYSTRALGWWPLDEEPHFLADRGSWWYAAPDASGPRHLAGLPDDGTADAVPTEILPRPVPWTAIGPRVLASLDDGAGDDLWSLDPLPLALGVGSILSAVDVEGWRFFETREPYPQEVRHLWRTDGTAAGTVWLASGRSLSLAAADGQAAVAYAAVEDDDAPGRLLRLQGSAVEAVELPRPATVELVAGEHVFLCDGDGLYRLSADFIADFTGAPIRLAPVCMEPEARTTLGELAVFALWTPETGEELWSSDGSPAGTALLHDIRPGQGSSAPTVIGRLGAEVLFVAAAPAGIELWATDGTATGTRALRRVGASVAPGSKEILASAWNGHLYFSDNAARIAKLWRTDGTPEGTTEVLRLDIPARDSRHFNDPPHYLGFLATLGQHLYFTLDGRELWRIDEAGEAALVERFAESSSVTTGAAVLAGELLFPGGSDELGVELWAYAPTNDRLRLVGDLAPGPEGSDPENLTVAGNAVYFSADDGFSGREVWRLDAVPDPAERFELVNDGACDGQTVWATVTIAGLEVAAELRPGDLGGPRLATVNAATSSSFGLLARAGETYFLVDPESGAELGRATLAATPCRSLLTIAATTPPDLSGRFTGIVAWAQDDGERRQIEVRVGAPDGKVFVRTRRPSGAKTTGNWLREGTLLFMCDGETGRVLDLARARAGAQAPATHRRRAAADPGA